VTPSVTAPGDVGHWNCSGVIHECVIDGQVFSTFNAAVHYLYCQNVGLGPTWNGWHTSSPELCVRRRYMVVNVADKLFFATVMTVLWY